MIIYLYKKTHNLTGFQYLGKTKSIDPHKYKGSGILWKKHIKKHGYDVTTEILRECSSNDEVKTWGEYYSTLWNVVSDPSWANLMTESGDTCGSGIGNKHPNYDHDQKTWIHKKTKMIEHLTLWELSNKYGVHKSGLSEISRGVRAGHCKGWYFVPDDKDPYIYLEEQLERKRNGPTTFKKKNKG